MTAPQDPFSTPPQGPGATPPGGYGAAPAGPGAYGQQPFATPPGYGAGGSPRNGFGIAALVLGVLALFSWFFIIGGLLGLVAIVLGVIGRRRAKRGEATNGGMALAGIVTGALSLLLTVLAVAGIAALFNSESGRGFVECVNEAATSDERAACEREFGESIGG